MKKRGDVGHRHGTSGEISEQSMGGVKERGDVEIAPYVGIFLNFLLKLKPVGHLKLALLPSLVGSTSNLTGIFSCSSRTWEMMPMMRP